VRILLVDDDKALGTMLTEYLSREGFEVDVLTRSDEALAAALSGRHAAVLLDVMMPGVSGIDVLRQIRQSSSIPILMLTAKGDDVDRVVGLEMGADDYIAKPFLSRELLARLRAVLRRAATVKAPTAEASFALDALALSPGRRSATWRETPLTLTGAEYKLLELLVRAAGQVVSKDDLSQKALGRRRESYDRSVDVHIGRLRQKLSSVSAGAVEIETIRGVGYALEVRQ
jgi:two-component system, OmpR family, response regulator